MLGFSISEFQISDFSDSRCFRLEISLYKNIKEDQHIIINISSVGCYKTYDAMTKYDRLKMLSLIIYHNAALSCTNPT